MSVLTELLLVMIRSPYIRIPTLDMVHFHVQIIAQLYCQPLIQYVDGRIYLFDFKTIGANTDSLTL